ncbi:MAG: hypothetical protein GWO02_10135 [Gammaproteobacteria bacterium]|nr:hypothetical protein [Gammaproteobacteria bacterium]
MRPRHAFGRLGLIGCVAALLIVAGCAGSQANRAVAPTPTPSLERVAQAYPEAIPDGFPIAAIDALRAQFMRCWRVPADAPDPASLVVRVRARLDIEGRLSGEPVVLPRLDGGDEGDARYRAVAHIARRAVVDCQPYDSLPKERYEDRKEIVFTFAPEPPP